MTLRRSLRLFLPWLGLASAAPAADTPRPNIVCEERNLIAEPSAREQLGIMRRELNRLLATAK